MSPLLKNLLIALGITLVLWGAMRFYTGSSTDAVLLEDGTLSVDMNSAAVQKSQVILANTRKIDEYRMDTSIFTDVKFSSLLDTRIDLIDVGTGRQNPFAPLE